MSFAFDDFKEEDHPRGTEGKNAGRFVKKGSGGGGGKQEGAETESGEAKAPAKSGKAGSKSVASVEDQKAGVSGLKDYLNLIKRMSGAQYKQHGMVSTAEFILNNGRAYKVDEKTYEGKRGPMHECYKNATLDAIKHKDRTYVEGYISVHGVPLSHAWTVDDKGQVFDSTVKPSQHITGYFGVPFSREYLLKATMKNKVYGLLGEMSKTLPDLLAGKDKKFRTAPDIHGSLAQEAVGDTTQPVESLDELYERSKKEEKGFKEGLEKLADKFGGTAKFTPPEFAEPGTILKSRKSAERKLRDELNNDFTLLRDVLRGTVVTDNTENARKSAAKFIEDHQDSILRVKDRFVNDLGGYRDILINYRTEGGLVAEVQFNSKHLLDAKFGAGHKIYDKMRELNARKQLRPEEVEEMRNLENEAIELYEDAYNKDGDGNWSGL